MRYIELYLLKINQYQEFCQQLLEFWEPFIKRLVRVIQLNLQLAIKLERQVPWVLLLCITQHMGTQSFYPQIQRTKQLWPSVLLKDTSAMTKTQKPTLWQSPELSLVHFRPLGHDTPQHSMWYLKPNCIDLCPDCWPQSRSNNISCLVRTESSIYIIDLQQSFDTPPPMLHNKTKTPTTKSTS